MNMRSRRLLVVLVAVLGLAVGAAPAEANHSKGKCKARGTTLAKNDSGRVYETTTKDGSEVLWGCYWARNRGFEMDVSSGDDISTFESYGNVMLRGRFVAWTFTSEDVSCKADCPPNYDATTEFVKTYDLKTRDEDSETSDPYSGSLRLNSGGALAWLTIAAGTGNYEVHAWDGAGHRTFDTGAITRFRLRGPTLSWVNGGDLARSERLSGSAAGAGAR
jgi:hypothetical protein